ncbi:hypothetical protein CKO28_23675 [Rhodovibrio sodomensis]|uniref:Glycosyltransferase subfamily 4-like N-terminal domain-containing protein n=1 Tax=Rhodovibrio sodomensis TaxID=1088 RepID=A0ABS1DKH1_9PROT|nr:glycosyltransferase family 4 protein [Rhodovibrio sodomensis]MBK1671011.1 hypothetical protein [Rhodovibrio sodomensis]
MPRVLFITRKWPPAVGGMETYSHELARALGDQVDLEVLALEGRADGRPPAATALLRFFLSALTLIARHRRGFDVVHVGDFVLYPLLVWHKLIAGRGRRVVSVHGLDLIFGSRDGGPAALYRAYMRVARWLEAHWPVADAVVANSRHTAGLAEEAGLSRIHLVPLGVRLPERAPEARPAEPFVLFVGRIVPRKGAVWFVREVLDRLPADVRFKVAGTVWSQADAVELGSHPRVDLLGRVPDGQLQRLRREAIAVVMPNVAGNGTDVEGFGLAALEAAAAGGVLVASAIEGITDAVIDGETGFLLPSGCARSWAAKIEHLAGWTEVERADLVGRARETLSERFSWERVAADTMEKAYLS